jgi:hypothetical protein
VNKIAVDIGSKFNSPFGKTEGLGSLVSIILSNTLIIAGVILLILLILGGFSIIMGAGQSDPQRVEQGKKATTAAVIGFIIIFAAYWIIQIAELVTGVQILNVPL